MKILLTILFATVVIVDMLYCHWLVRSVLLVVPPVAFYIVSRDKANTLRVAICCISSILPLFIAPIPYVLSLFLNDEYIRKVAHARIIVLTGIDGSGKTSHSKTTADFLRSRGIDAVYYHFFKHPLVTSLTLLKARLLRKSVHGAQIVYKSEFRQKLRRPGAVLRPIVQFVDNWLYIGPRLIWNILRGRWVICDRYYYDYYIRFKCLGYPVPRLLEKLVFKLTPKPSLLIVLDVNPILSFLRRQGEHPLWYYVLARREFLRLARELGGYVINTQRPFDVVQHLINRVIEKKLLAGAS